MGIGAEASSDSTKAFIFYRISSISLGQRCSRGGPVSRSSSAFSCLFSLRSSAMMTLGLMLWLTTLVFLIMATRIAKLQVLMDSRRSSSRDEIVANMRVLQFPPMLSCRTVVRRESLKGTQVEGMRSFSWRVRMTRSRQNRPRLMAMASFSLSPMLSLSLICSDPERSTKLISECCLTLLPCVLISSLIVKMQCERVDTSFLGVWATSRFSSPMRSSCTASSMLLASWMEMPLSTSLPSTSLQAAILGRSVILVVACLESSRLQPSSMQIQRQLIHTVIVPSVFLLFLSKMYSIVIGIMPRSEQALPPPVMLQVFPEPVCPYAKMVPLQPFSASSITSLAMESKISSCEVLASKVRSKVNLKLSRWLLMQSASFFCLSLNWMFCLFSSSSNPSVCFLLGRTRRKVQIVLLEPPYIQPLIMRLFNHGVEQDRERVLEGQRAAEPRLLQAQVQEAAGAQPDSGGVDREAEEGDRTAAQQVSAECVRDQPDRLGAAGRGREDRHKAGVYPAEERKAQVVSVLFGQKLCGHGGRGKGSEGALLDGGRADRHDAGPSCHAQRAHREGEAGLRAGEQRVVRAVPGDEGEVREPGAGERGHSQEDQVGEGGDRGQERRGRQTEGRDRGVEARLLQDQEQPVVAQRVRGGEEAGVRPHVPVAQEQGRGAGEGAEEVPAAHRLPVKVQGRGPDLSEISVKTSASSVRKRK